ncbi:hypothetical protein GGF32_006138 [Allomyces javanicus]|nr:hypothetical protein GGF32_006138 [Allomyces javanicus]
MHTLNVAPAFKGEDDIVASQALEPPLAPILTHLSLVAYESCCLFGRTASLTVIATNLPPNLIKLELVSAFLGGDDLTAFVWPKSLLHLNLKSNWFKKIPAAALPIHFQTLKPNENSELSDDNATE